MIITLTRPVTKRCPFVDEIDIGELEVMLDCDEAPELHKLASSIDDLRGPMTHEAFTHAVAQLMPADAIVTTHWRTGPWEVTVTT